MFFSGDASVRKRVDLGGRSNKQSDRQVVLTQARLEREHRKLFRQQIAAATKIQKFFRGWKDVQMERMKVRHQFHNTFGDRCQKSDWHCFGPNSEFLSQLLFFFTSYNIADVMLLEEACKLLLQYVQHGGNIVNLFAANDYSSNRSIAGSRVKRLSYVCLLAVFENRNHLKNQLLRPPTDVNMTTVLLETVICLTKPELPWVCKTVEYLLQRKIFLLLRCIILTGLQDVKSPLTCDSASSLEYVVAAVASHIAHHPCYCSNSDLNADLKWSFFSQLLSIPFLWRHFPYLKEVFWAKRLGKHYIEQMATQNGVISLVINKSLPDDIGQEYPGYACLLGNLLEAAGVIFSVPECSSDTAINFLHVSTFLLETLPAMDSLEREKPLDEDETMEEEHTDVISSDIQKQISSSMDARLLQHLVNTLFRDASQDGCSSRSCPSNNEVEAIGAVCTFLHVTFSTLSHELIMTLLAYRTELVSALWKFIKHCHENKKWPSDFKLTVHIPGEAPGWLLPLAVFCPVYKHLLKFVDTEAFYEQEKPLDIREIKSLVIIIKQALWQLLWIIPAQATPPKKMSKTIGNKKLSIEVLKNKARVAMSELLSQLQDWNNRRNFMSADDFHLQEAMSDDFVSQAVNGNTRASEILKLAPFLVPCTSRVKIFAFELATARQRGASQHAFGGQRLKIKRDRILEDTFSQLSELSEEDLRGPIKISYVDKFGVEEVGIDGGGIFKDFMENSIQAAFDVQYGLFKETADHFLYPNPGSALVHEQHLQFFHFLGNLLGKAMYEGILVDIRFAKFFLSKLKAKSNFLHDLPSLDPELYRHLLFLKHFKGDVSELELYFVVVNNEYGEQTEEELLPGGKDMRVTKDNVISFIHLVANYRLNYQIRNQSLHFLRGFQQLIKTEWIDMFNENEIQLLISGSSESLNIDDLHANAQYSGGYHPDHHVIQTFWGVLKNFSLEHQKKFLKFATGCSRGPFLGFKYLEPKFCIQRAAPPNASEEDLERLPTASTCMNLLKLPPYVNKEQMRTKLMYAITADAGFDLS